MAEKAIRTEEIDHSSYDELLYSSLLRPLGMRLSYTRMDCYRTCPRRYKYIYLGREEEPASEAMLLGKAVHSALETWVAEGGEDVGDLLDFFSTSCATERKQGRISEEEEEAARAMLMDYYTVLEGVDRTKVIGIEHQFELIIPGVRIPGVIDRAGYIDDDEETLLITDYKSGRSSITPAQAKNNAQMAIYTMAARAIWPGAKRYITELNYPRLNKVIRYEFTREDLDRHVKEIQNTALNIKLDSRFAPKGSPPICGNCGFNDRCGTGKYQARIWEGIKRKREAKNGK